MRWSTRYSETSPFSLTTSLKPTLRGLWRRFVEVGRWALLAYAITAGLIEFSFVRNHLSGGPLVVLTLSLVVYAVHVPVLIAFTVARYTE